MNLLMIYIGNLVSHIVRAYPAVLTFVIHTPWLKKRANRFLIERYAGHGQARPRPYSLRLPFTAWPTLTDKTYTGRHLGPDPIDRKRPDTKDLVALFSRDNGEIPSQDTSLLFAYMAQWFTDSFIRTKSEQTKDDWRRNTSNHEIDLCQIYGLNEKATAALRTGKDGQLKTQTLENGEIYPPRLLREGSTPEALIFTDPAFENLYDLDDLKSVLGRVDPLNWDKLFATGLERGNASPGNIILNTVFLRAHNHVAAQLARRYTDWDDDQIFETARNVMIVLLLQIVLREYISHVATMDFPFDIDPDVGETASWKRSNWISIEFGLLYRWHSLVPDEVALENGKVALPDTVLNPDFVTDHGIGPLITAASKQHAGRIGLNNSPAMFTTARDLRFDGELLQMSVEEKTLKMARRARLKPYNAYRQAFDLKPIRSFKELTGEHKISAELARLYGSVDQLDWYVGLLAEKHDKNAMLGELMTHMVAFDAFTHIYGNPLVSKAVFREETFSSVGWGLIGNVKTLSDLVSLVVKDARYVSFTT